jgi:hypothetical protein
MKQTAVEWFFKCLFEEHGEFTLEQIKTDNPKLWEIYQQAKEMFEEQITDAFNNGFSTTQWDKIKENKAKQYYYETFKSE